MTEDFAAVAGTGAGMRSGWLPWASARVALALALLGPAEAFGGTRDEWVRDLVLQLKMHRRVPPEAKDKGGKAKVVFEIDRDGRLRFAALLESTGEPALDQEALAMVERSQPFAPLPREWPDEELRFTLPVVFVPLRPSGVLSDEITANDKALKAKLNTICRGC
ncbi:energy transducer TonB family protein [Bradyrhizobium sp. HKCCYLRH3099]|uniref:energy transducer TonB family protein n=1 Tax=unclassified Bradyrhizobium TaxID=2631580 RepID=UPI003EB9F14B